MSWLLKGERYKLDSNILWDELLHRCCLPTSINSLRTCVGSIAVHVCCASGGPVGGGSRLCRQSVRCFPVQYLL